MMVIKLPKTVSFQYNAENKTMIFNTYELIEDVIEKINICFFEKIRDVHLKYDNDEIICSVINRQVCDYSMSHRIEYEFEITVREIKKNVTEKQMSFWDKVKKVFGFLV